MWKISWEWGNNNKKSLFYTSVHPFIQPILRMHTVHLSARHRRITKTKDTFPAFGNFQAASGQWLCRPQGSSRTGLKWAPSRGMYGRKDSNIIWAIGVVQWFSNYAPDQRVSSESTLRVVEVVSGWASRTFPASFRIVVLLHFWECLHQGKKF